MSKSYESLAEKLCLPIERLGDIDNWSAGPETLDRLYDYIIDNEPFNVVEFGSGLSTLVIALALKKVGQGRVVSLEHDETYQKRTRELIKFNGCESYSNIVVSPLEGFVPFYRNIPHSVEIGMVFVDGPPASAHPMSRYWAKRIFSNLAPDAFIFLDDAQRSGEKMALGLWVDEFPGLAPSETINEADGRVCKVLSHSRKLLKRVVVSIPNTGMINKFVLLTILTMTKDPRYKIHLKMPTFTPVENGYNHMVKELLKGDFDFWLNIDSDNPPIRNPLDLVELDKDVVGLPTPIWYCPENLDGIRPWLWNIYQHDSKNDNYREFRGDKNGLIQVDAVGMGCTLIAKRVFENPEMQKGAFLRKWHKDGTVRRGTDIAFCERARENGFEIFAHWDYPCKHFKNIELVEAIRAFSEQKTDEELVDRMASDFALKQELGG